MDDVKQQVVDRLKQANNILVTVRANPSVDLLSACIGLALLLDKLNKHAAAVFSGEVPSAMEFLKPEETIETTPNSLRDFIIALDKTKADKLRYKVEDKMVRIFITPYKTSLSQDDLEFSQGDFNIDAVVALGVHDQAELDAAITAHGRILHDATVISVNNTPNGSLGSLNWQQVGVSSVSEMVAELAESLDSTVFDEQIATALLTGIVAETERFSNEKTTPQVMSIAGKLMAAGANQQLVANELQGSGELPHTTSAANDGTLEITHPAEPAEVDEEPMADAPTAAEPAMPEESVLPLPEPSVPEESKPTSSREMLPLPEPSAAGGSNSTDALFTGEFSDASPSEGSSSYLIDHGASKTTTPDHADDSASQAPSLAPLDLPPVMPADGTTADSQQQASIPLELPRLDDATPLVPTPPESTLPMEPTQTPPSGQTLEELEASVKSSHAAAEAEPAPEPDKPADEPAPATDTLATGDRIDDARQEVLKALQQSKQPLPPVFALNANHIPLDEPTQEEPKPNEATPKPDTAGSTAIEIDPSGNFRPGVSVPTPSEAVPAESSAPSAMDMPLPPVAPPQNPPQAAPPSFDPNSPPPVPPPLTPPNPFGP